MDKPVDFSAIVGSPRALKVTLYPQVSRHHFSGIIVGESGSAGLHCRLSWKRSFGGEVAQDIYGLVAFLSPNQQR